MWGLAPLVRRLGNDFGFTAAVMTGCVTLYVVSVLLDTSQIGQGGLFGLLGPSTNSLFVLGASGSIPVFELGRWWTVLSAAWLHGGLLHILFNMMWVRQLGPACAELFGAGRMVIIYTVAGVTGFAASSIAWVFFGGIPILGGAGFTVGASAPIFGLLGAIVLYGHRSGSSMTKREGLQYALMLGVFGLIMPGIDNWAHAGGFAGGWLMAKILDPLTPERMDHLALAVGCVLLTLASIAASLLHGFALFAGN
jgi:rhomboid protease GluP